MNDKKSIKNPEKEAKNMDPLNKKAVEVLANKGDEAFIKHVFTGDKEHGDEGKQLTYAEMRDRYG